VKRWDVQRLLLTLAAGLLVWAAVAALCLMVGSTGRFAWPSHDLYVIRRQPVLLASLIGAALAAAGVVFQAILRNPLADPYLLGASSGASLFAYLWQFPVLITAVTRAIGPAGYHLSEQLFAFLGALLAVAIVFLLASSRGRLEPVTLLLVGVIVNSINGALFLLVNAISKDRPGAGGPFTYLVGGIHTTLAPAQVTAATIVVAAGWLALLYLSGPLNAATLSEGEAQSLGVRIHALRWVGLITASLLTAAVVAISGPIGFIGLICPHLARLVTRSHDVRRTLPLATAAGASLLALADAASRYLASAQRAHTILPVGVLTALLGGPFFLYLLWHTRRRANAPA
jgi:iron complex transport system permease protein